MSISPVASHKSAARMRSSMSLTNVTRLQNNSSYIGNAMHVTFFRIWQIGTGQTQAQWKAFEGELEAFQAAIRKSGGPFLLGSEVSLVS